MRSEKKVSLRGMYRAKIGFDLQKGFNIEVHRGGLFRRGQMVVQLPRAEILSVEPLDVKKNSVSGLINWVTKKDLEDATRELAELALDKASKLDMLDAAEKRIESRLNEALLPKLVHYRFEHSVKFLEMTSLLPSFKREEAKTFELTAGQTETGNGTEEDVQESQKGTPNP
jgi:hypothetical protein